MLVTLVSDFIVPLIDNAQVGATAILVVRVSDDEKYIGYLNCNLNAVPDTVFLILNGIANIEFVSAVLPLYCKLQPDMSPDVYSTYAKLLPPIVLSISFHTVYVRNPSE